MDLGVHPGWAGSSSDCMSLSWYDPSPSQALSKRMFEAFRVKLPSGGRSVALPPLLGPIHSLHWRNTGSWQLLAGLVLSEVQGCLWKILTPQSCGNREPNGLRRKTQDTRSFFLSHSWAQAVCPPRVGPEGCIPVGLQPGGALVVHLQAPAQGWHHAALHLLPPGP